MAETNTSAEATSKSTHTKKGTLPRKEKDLYGVSTFVSEKWESTPALTLIWTDSKAFKDCIAEFGMSLSGKDGGGGERAPVTQNLKNLDKGIDTDLKHLKGYLSEKYGAKEALAYYAKFGIVKSDNKYVLPKDRNKRMAALDLLCNAVVAEGFADKKYGKAHWDAIRTQYQELHKGASVLDGKISTEVATKQMCILQIRKTLNSIIKLLQANYPDNPAAKLREWGFQKEKY
jgi:hypothetical protein